MDQKNKMKTKPWYKYPMVWLVVGLPLIAVIASISTLVIAVQHAPQVLEHNISYKKDNNS